MIHYGNVDPNSTLYIPFTTYDSNGASITMSGFAVGDIKIYKNGGTTERSSTSGFSLLDTDGTDFDAVTGLHGFSIDLSDNTDAGFYSDGAQYWVVVSTITADTRTVTFIAATFSIGYQNVDTVSLNGSTASAVDLQDFADAGYDPATNKVEGVKTVDTNTDMRGTDNAALAVNYTAARAVYLDNINGHVAQTGDTYTRLGAPAGASVSADIAAIDTSLDDAKGATFNTSTDSLEAIRDRGDAAWVTGGGGAVSQILNVTPLVPESIDLANTVTWRLGLSLVNAVDDLPTVAEITPGTISIERKAIGGTSWTAIVTDAACSESAGLIYYDEVFDSASGYAAGDSIRITFKSQKITVDANDFEITDATGILFYTAIREAMRGTDSAALAVNYTSARAGYLDSLNGHVAQTGDSFARLGAPTGVSVSADVADIKTQVGTAGAGLTDLGGMSTAMKGEVNAEVDSALDTAIPVSPTADSINERMKAMDELTEAGGAGDLAAVLTDTGTSIPNSITTIQSDTDDIQSRLPAALIGGRMNSDVEAINNNSTAAQNLGSSALAVVTGAASGVPTTTSIPTNLTETSNDIFIGRIIIFTSGNAKDEATDITDYDGTTKTLTVTALSQTPSSSDTFVIV